MASKAPCPLLSCMPCWRQQFTSKWHNWQMTLIICQLSHFFINCCVQQGIQDSRGHSLLMPFSSRCCRTSSPCCSTSFARSRPILVLHHRACSHACLEHHKQWKKSLSVSNGKSFDFKGNSFDNTRKIGRLGANDVQQQMEIDQLGAKDVAQHPSLEVDRSPLVA